MDGIRKGLIGGISLVERLKLNEKNIRLIKREARIIIIISADNQGFEVYRNANGRLNVLAVLGPVQKFEEKLLLEIGMGRARPYCPSEGYRKALEIKKKTKCPWMPKRQKIFSLSLEQYVLIAPEIFNIIRDIAEEKVRSWKSGPCFWLPTPRNYWSAWSGQIIPSTSHFPWLRGIRFSFSKQDEYLLQDLFWAELNLNNGLNRSLSGTAAYIRRRFYQENKERFKRGKPLNGIASDIYSMIKSLPYYLREELADYCFSSKNNPEFLTELKKHLILPKRKTSPEQVMAQAAEKIASPLERLKDIQLRVISGFRTKKNYVIAEIYPFEYPPPRLDSENNDEIPF
ncbi:hypothetical protein KKD72_02650 [Patescibacteria group bacterium]|nr:hypothetical protein [Patescibacteria group bacterium]